MVCSFLLDSFVQCVVMTGPCYTPADDRPREPISSRANNASAPECSQYHDLKTIDAFDVRDRLATLKPKLLLLRGVDDPGHPPEYEKEMHEAVPGSRCVKLSGAGHFPPTEIPDKVNARGRR
jgi:pimeloyl-ACP methyl ester carboxylesterase